MKYDTWQAPCLKKKQPRRIFSWFFFSFNSPHFFIVTTQGRVMFTIRTSFFLLNHLKGFSSFVSFWGRFCLWSLMFRLSSYLYLHPSVYAVLWCSFPRFFVFSMANPLSLSHLCFRGVKWTKDGRPRIVFGREKDGCPWWMIEIAWCWLRSPSCLHSGNQPYPGWSEGCRKSQERNGRAGRNMFTFDVYIIGVFVFQFVYFSYLLWIGFRRVYMRTSGVPDHTTLSSRARRLFRRAVPPNTATLSQFSVSPMFAY